MRTLRLLVAGLALFSLPACQRTSADVVSATDVVDMVDVSSSTSRRFVAERRTDGGATVRAEGVVEDDYRYQLTFVVNDAEAYSEVVYDDRRYVRVAPAAGLPEGLVSHAGQWVLDAAGAPNEFARPGQAESVVPASRALEQVRALERLPDRLRGMRKWDRDSSSYLEAHDKFPPHEEDGVRFDVIPAAYDGDLVFKEGVPADLAARLEPYFLYLSVWVEDGRVRRVETLFDIDVERVRADMARAKRIHDERAGLAFDPGSVPPPPPRYAERYTLEYPPEGVTLVRPDATGTVTFPPLVVGGRS